ncbi:MAG: glycoside hydrolase family 130 protein [Victivallales bacterium]|nr:glycoside hydrolase family 130 protein [Victivallales bacterium]
MLRYDTLLKRNPANPIISPMDFPYGAADQVFNPGQCMFQGKTLLILSVKLRNERYARAHVATSDNGVDFDIWEEPLFKVDKDKQFGNLDTHPIDFRITQMGDTYYIMRPGNSEWGCVAFLYKTKDFKTVEPVEIIALPHNRVPCLFPEKINGEYVRLDRPYSVGAPYEKSYANIWVSRSPDLIHWGQHRPLLKRDAFPWSGLKVGPTPPIKTEKGWLEIVHGVQECFVSWRYSLGAILLDLENPEKIIGAMQSYILTPETEYEHHGVIPDVVFATGAIADLKTRRLRVYYGGADTCVCLAEGDLDAIIDGCIKGI